MFSGSPFRNAGDGSSVGARVRAKKIRDEWGEKYREDPPEDYDDLWNAVQPEVNDDDNNDITWAINYGYMTEEAPEMYSQSDLDEARETDIGFDQLMYFVEEQDIVTREDLDDAGHVEREMDRIDRRSESSMDRNDPMFELDDQMFVVDIEEDDEEAYSIDVSDVDNGCEEGIISAIQIRNQLMTLVSDEDLSPKNLNVVMIYAEVQKIEGLFRGMKSCDVGEHHG